MFQCGAFSSHALARCDVAQLPFVRNVLPGSASNQQELGGTGRKHLRLKFRLLKGESVFGRFKAAAQYKRLNINMGILEEPVEVLVKANSANPAEFGDCPFSHRVILTLEEKHISYDMKLVDTSNKPQWFLELNPEGKVPVIKYGGKWQPDSDVIVKILEEEKPEPSLVTPEELSTIGSKFFGAAAKFLKSKEDDEGLEAALVSELRALDVDLKKTAGAFVAGSTVSQKDLDLAPKLFALRVAGKHFKKFEIPSELTALHEYVKALDDLESFKKTKCTEEAVIAGWTRARG